MKKNCFICDRPLGFTNAHCITKDGYLVCATDSKKICPDNQANNFSISLKTSKFINSHSASKILQLLGVQPSTPYKDNADQYRSKLYKTTDKLNKKAEKARIKERSTPAPAINPSQQKLVCPHCGSTNIQPLGQYKKGFSVGKAVGGAVLTGGVGTLAGFAGKKTGQTDFVCMSCEKQFKK